MPKLSRAALLLPLVALLAACGQRGDLYLPQAEREAVVTVPANAQIPTTAPQAQDNDEDADTDTAPGTTSDGQNTGTGQ